jgi:hypothetical protein
MSVNSYIPVTIIVVKYFIPFFEEISLLLIKAARLQILFTLNLTDARQSFTV